MPFQISKEIEFDAGHRVPNHRSKCRNPHGHRYRVRATIAGELVTERGASNEGMLADFGDLKVLLTERIHDPLDHGFIVHDGDEAMILALSTLDPHPKIIIFPHIPTAENLARWSYDQLKEGVADMGFVLEQIDVWETPTSIATYYA